MRNSFIAITVAGLMLTVSSCEKAPAPKVIPDAEPIVLKPEYQAKTAGNRSFAIDLFKTAVAKSGGDNLLVSPFSVNTALGMLWNGAAEDTGTEIGTVLRNDGYTTEQINDYAKTLTGALLKVDPTTDLRIANSIWADNTTPFLDPFTETVKKWYGAKAQNVDFTDPSTFDVIDKWCRDNTNNRIDKITEGMTTDTRFALINAVYFNAKWKHKFDKSATRGETFTDSDGGTAEVKMMNQKEDLLYADDDQDWKMLALPYGNRAFSMIILMPYGDTPLDELAETLSAEEYYALLDALNVYSVTVKLPKFKAEYAYKLHEEILPEMGMVKVFDDSQANLSGMSDTPMYVNMVMHKTYIDVYEEGTEAAAATSASGMATSPGPGTPINFFVNRPFIYSIIENSTATILFMGRVNGF